MRTAPSACACASTTARRAFAAYTSNHGGGAAGGFGSYENTAIGQIIVLAYLNAYTDLVTQLGGLPVDAAAAAPEAR